MKRPLLLSCVVATATLTLGFGRDLQPRPSDPFFQKYEGWAAPAPQGLLLKTGDRLAICGDSITEQRMYSRLIEAYLTACVPELKVTCRQFGWSGEQAGGFYSRMKNDVLRFQPTIATTCYGMNDHRYVPFTDEIGATYRENQTKVVKAFKDAGCRVVLGSSGTIHTVPNWVKTATGTWEDLNLSLLRLRNIDIEIAEAENVAFADVYWPMLTAGFASRQKYGEQFHLEGGDGVHPTWAGQTVMASAFLTGLGLDGAIGTVTFDPATNQAEATDGHQVLGAGNGEIRLRSSKMALCAAGGDAGKDDNIRAGMALIGFNDQLNRFILKLKNPTAASYSVTWGSETHDFTREQLTAGVNLADAFQQNGFSAAFEKVWNAVGAKQDYETRQIKQLFHGPEGAADMEGTVAVTEKAREKLVRSLSKACAPVDHTIKVAAK